MRDTANSSGTATEKDEFATLLRRVAVHRDKAAYRVIFRHFAPRVRAFLLGRQNSPAVADDVVQDVMLTIWRKAESYDPAKAAVSSWIFTIARNRLIDHHRRLVRRTDYEAEAQLEEPPQAQEADELMMRSEETRRVATALECLPDDQRQILELSYREGLPHQEIASRLALPLGTVKSRIRLAMQKLKTRLGVES
jgi:RNA polymerase sigma-70 factor (ECF subfamily)